MDRKQPIKHAKPRTPPDWVGVYCSLSSAEEAAAGESYAYVIEERTVRAFGTSITVYALAYWYT